MSLGISLAERGLLPDAITRTGIRRLLRDRLKEQAFRPPAAGIAELAAGPVAVAQDAANRQHYAVPPGFYELVLGSRLKYSSCWWDASTPDLDSAEDAMLALYIQRADLRDGQSVLELGCGWGSLCLLLAERFPNSRITSVSNSAVQRSHIEATAARRGIRNLSIVTADLATWNTSARHDRLVSIECLEHVRNHGELLRRAAHWLEDDGQAFIHIFCHQRYCYPFEVAGDDDWMARHFFTGGLMPSFDLFRHYPEHLRVVRDWQVPGTHYARTARAWLERLDQHRDEVLALFARDMPMAEARKQVQRWRIFFMACEELFGYDQGREWLVGHYLLKRA